MTDLEITRKCAEAMGLKHRVVDGYVSLNTSGCWVYGQANSPYDPLHDDAQAMAMVKKFHLYVCHDGEKWSVRDDFLGEVVADSEDLNRAICECCVARMGK